MNIYAKSCKYYEYCIQLRYNNCRQLYMTDVEVIENRHRFSMLKIVQDFKRQITLGWKMYTLLFLLLVAIFAILEASKNINKK